MKKSVKYLFYVVSFTVLVFVIMTTTARVAYADVTPKDVQTIIRTIGFLENASISNSVIAIVYDPDNSESASNARQISDLIAQEAKGLQPRLVTVSGLSGLQGANFAFVTEGMSAYYQNISTATREKKIVSFTLSRSCVDQDCCTVYINSKNRVEIVINKKVADIVNAQFKPVFLMMVTVI